MSMQKTVIAYKIIYCMLSDTFNFIYQPLPHMNKLKNEYRNTKITMHDATFLYPDFSIIQNASGPIDAG